MARRPRRFTTEFVRPTFPVVAMYVVSVLLLSYFTFTVRRDPPELWIDVRLPQEEGAGELPLFNRGIEWPVTITVSVAAGPNGSLGGMTLMERTGPLVDVDRPGVPIGAGLTRFEVELRARHLALRGRHGRVVLELGEGITHDGYLRLIVAAMRAGFDDVTAFPADPRKR